MAKKKASDAKKRASNREAQRRRREKINDGLAQLDHYKSASDHYKSECQRLKLMLRTLGKTNSDHDDDSDDDGNITLVTECDQTSGSPSVQPDEPFNVEIVSPGSVSGTTTPHDSKLESTGSPNESELSSHQQVTPSSDGLSGSIAIGNIQFSPDLDLSSWEAAPTAAFDTIADMTAPPFAAAPLPYGAPSPFHGSTQDMRNNGFQMNNYGGDFGESMLAQPREQPGPVTSSPYGMGLAMNHNYDWATGRDPRQQLPQMLRQARERRQAMQHDGRWQFKDCVPKPLHFHSLAKVRPARFGGVNGPDGSEKTPEENSWSSQDGQGRHRRVVQPLPASWLIQAPPDDATLARALAGG
ncbi:hypothetical protein ANO11243_097110 [Dothideomycetidae sp. 11243]|nr:hypothetical protein ANO11243_097110 [fungal sp. No.11243]